MKRAIERFLEWRRAHPLMTLVFLPIDIIVWTIILVVPALVAIILIAFAGWPAKLLGANDAGVLFFGTVLLGIPSYFIYRHIKRKRT